MDSRDNKPTYTQKTTLITILSIATIKLIIDVLIILIINYIGTIRFNKSLVSESNETYVVSEETKSTYNHLLEYLKNNAATKYPDSLPQRITAVSFDNNVLSIAAEDNDYSIIFNVTTEFASQEEALNSFQNETPETDKYTINMSFQINDDEKLNINTYVNGKYIGHASYIDGLDKRYISFTGMRYDNTINYCVNQEYNETGFYDVKKVNDSHPLYNFYYYLLNN